LTSFFSCAGDFRVQACGAVDVGDGEGELVAFGAVVAFAFLAAADVVALGVFLACGPVSSRAS
jgi:hypothetical protein